MTPPAFRAGLRVAISPADVGARVTIRRVLTDGREGFGDVVGELVSWEGGVLVVRRRSGELVAVPESTLVGARRVPDRPS